MLNDKPIFRYCNTDLDLVAPVSLDELAASLESLGVFPIHMEQGKDGLWFGCFETNREHTGPDSNIAEMLSAIEALPAAAMEVWKLSAKREFSVGYECGDEPRAFSQGLSNETLRRMADCGATFAVTLYPYRPDDDSDVEVGS